MRTRSTLKLTLLSCLPLLAATLTACPVPIEVGRVSKLTLCDPDTGSCGDELTVLFGDVRVGQSVTRAVKVKNEGQAGAILSVQSDSPSFIVGARSLQLSAQGEAVFDVTFTPGALGERVGKLAIHSATPGLKPEPLTLRGRGMASMACVNPTAIAFSQQVLGAQGTAGVELRSCGNLPLALGELSIQGSAFSVAQGAQAPLPLSLPPDTVLPIKVAFRSTTPGDFAGMLVLGTDSVFTPIVQVPLTASARTQPCRLEWTATQLDFGQASPGQRATRDVKAVSSGPGPCKVEPPVLDGAARAAGFALEGAPTEPILLEPTRTYGYRLVYAPVDLVGPDTGTLRVSSDDPVSPAVLQLLGTPRAPNGCSLTLLTAPDADGRLLDFDTQAVGSVTELVATLINVGTAPCQISQVTLGSSVDTDSFSLTTSPALPATLANDEVSSVRVSVRFSPGAAGTWLPSANFFQVTTDEGGPTECDGSAGCKRVRMAAAAAAAAPSLGMVPSTVDLGLATLGCHSRPRAITLLNTTPAVLTVTSVTASAGFTLVAPPALPLTLTKGELAAFSVRFKPTAAGAATGTLTVQHSSGVSTAALKGTGTGVTATADTFTQGNAGLADVLFIVDNSGSMQPSQAALAAAGPAFMQAADARGGNYSLAVTTTDMWCSGDSECGRFVPTSGPGPKVITSTMPNRATLFDAYIKRGVLGSAVEEGLSPVLRALSPPLSNGLNTGFLRPQAKLGVVVLTDEEDQSPVSLQSVPNLLWALKGFTGPTERVRFHAIIPKVTAASCLVPSSNARYPATVAAIGGQSYDLCSPSWNAFAASIADDLFQLPRQFYLSRPRATGQALTVKVNGVTKTEGTHYTYDAGPNAITFLAGSVPTPGQVVQASFSALCTP